MLGKQHHICHQQWKSHFGDQVYSQMAGIVIADLFILPIPGSSKSDTIGTNSYSKPTCVFFITVIIWNNNQCIAFNVICCTIGILDIMGNRWRVHENRDISKSHISPLQCWQMLSLHSHLRVFWVLMHDQNLPENHRLLFFIIWSKDSAYFSPNYYCITYYYKSLQISVSYILIIQISNFTINLCLKLQVRIQFFFN